MWSLFADAIKSHARSTFPNECCGVIVENDRAREIIQMKNISLAPETTFLLDFYEILGRDVSYIYHSHPSSSSVASPADVEYCNEIRIPFLIYSLKDDDFSLLMPR